MRTLLETPAGGLWTEDSEGDGEPVVLLHPGIGDLRCWEAVWPGLTDTHRVVRYDFRGYGGSPAASAPYDWVEDLFAVMDACGLESAHLVGNSQGGATAVEAALRRPDRVRSLVLLAPSVGGWEPEGTPELEARWEAAEQALAAGDDGPMVAFVLEVWCAAGHEPLVRDLVRTALAAEEGEKRWLTRLPDVRDRLGEVSAPTVLMLAMRDFPSLVELDERMAAAIPGCRLVRLAGVDHLPQLRVPELVVETVRQHCV
jgi:pimeloyl-ACP methyl ester carboxylesterase